MKPMKYDQREESYKTMKPEASSIIQKAKQRKMRPRALLSTEDTIALGLAYMTGEITLSQVINATEGGSASAYVTIARGVKAAYLAGKIQIIT
jgi:hypothetical protein